MLASPRKAKNDDTALISPLFVGYDNNACASIWMEVYEVAKRREDHLGCTQTTTTVFNRLINDHSFDSFDCCL
jgi:hypothetical protein